MDSGVLRNRIALLVAWLNFVLLVACALKFIPIALWGLENLGLIDIGNLGFPTPADQKNWALDLISDTHLILFVWLSCHNKIFFIIILRNIFNSV